jgi:hypothetical protein
VRSLLLSSQIIAQDVAGQEMTGQSAFVFLPAQDKMDSEGVRQCSLALNWTLPPNPGNRSPERVTMTEAEWLECSDPTPMLEFLRGKASDRKLRLFGCACVRRVWHLLTDARSRDAVEIAEAYADRLTNHARLIRARDEAREAKRQIMPPAQVVAWRGTCAAQDATRDTGRSAALNCMAESSRAVNLRDTNHCDPTELQQQTPILHCIFGNPFRPVPLSPAWLVWNDGTIPKLAQAIYDERRFQDLPILADALEEAGCNDADILTHCRSEGPHVRGCWLLDLLLGKK